MEDVIQRLVLFYRLLDRDVSLGFYRYSKGKSPRPAVRLDPLHLWLAMEDDMHSGKLMLWTKPSFGGLWIHGVDPDLAEGEIVKIMEQGQWMR